MKSKGGLFKLEITSEKLNLSIVAFSLFSGWLLSLPFEGQVLFSLVEQQQLVGSRHIFLGIGAHFLGLALSGLFARYWAIRKAMLTVIGICILGSSVFFFPYSMLWDLSLVIISFCAGLFVGWWGFYFKKYSSPEARVKTAAELLIYSNILMIATNLLTVHSSARLGLTAAIALLFAAFFCLHKLEEVAFEPECDSPGQAPMSSLVFLLAFVLIITINSGFMYQVVNPAFAHLKQLASCYWALPYILAVVVMRNLPAKFNRAYLLYIALSMIGISFLLFMWLDRSAASYLVIDTLMLSAFGICDLFWWSILGSYLDYTTNPAQVLGLGLSMNVLGVLLGSMVSKMALKNHVTVSGVGLLVIFISIIILPLLYAKLTAYLKKHVFLIQFGEPEQDEEQGLFEFKAQRGLTDKETKVVALLLRGYTYKAAAEALFISENTMRYHIKNIYQKLNINSKMELIELFTGEGQGK